MNYKSVINKSIFREPSLFRNARLQPFFYGLEGALVDALIHVVPLFLHDLPEIAAGNVLSLPDPLLGVGPEILNPTQIWTPGRPWHNLKLLFLLF